MFLLDQKEAEKTPLIFYFKCSVRWKTCSLLWLCSQVRTTGNTHSGQKERSRHPRASQTGNKEYAEDIDLSGPCYLNVSLPIIVINMHSNLHGILNRSLWHFSKIPHSCQNERGQSQDPAASEISHYRLPPLSCLSLALS